MTEWDQKVSLFSKCWRWNTAIGTLPTNTKLRQVSGFMAGRKQSRKQDNTKVFKFKRWGVNMCLQVDFKDVECWRSLNLKTKAWSTYRNNQEHHSPWSVDTAEDQQRCSSVILTVRCVFKEDMKHWTCLPHWSWHTGSCSAPSSVSTSVTSCAWLVEANRLTLVYVS